jgi:hypothetical protein
MIPGFVGSNIEGVLRGQEREIVEEGRIVRKDMTHGNWDKLPASVSEIGSAPEAIFAGYADVQKKVGKNEMKNVPFGAIAIWTLADKLAAGLQQLLAGCRKFKVSEISRSDIFACNRETEKETGIPFITDVEDDKAKKLLATK